MSLAEPRAVLLLLALLALPACGGDEESRDGPPEPTPPPPAAVGSWVLDRDSYEIYLRRVHRARFRSRLERYDEPVQEVLLEEIVEFTREEARRAEGSLEIRADRTWRAIFSDPGGEAAEAGTWLEQRDGTLRLNAALKDDEEPWAFHAALEEENLTLRVDDDPTSIRFQRR